MSYNLYALLYVDSSTPAPPLHFNLTSQKGVNVHCPVDSIKKFWLNNFEWSCSIDGWRDSRSCNLIFHKVQVRRKKSRDNITCRWMILDRQSM